MNPIFKNIDARHRTRAFYCYGVKISHKMQGHVHKENTGGSEKEKKRKKKKREPVSGFIRSDRFRP